MDRRDFFKTTAAVAAGAALPAVDSDSIAALEATKTLVGEDVGTVSGTLWTPARNADGTIKDASWSILPLNKWMEVEGSSFNSVKATLKSDTTHGLTPGLWYTGRDEWYAAIFSNFTGCAKDLFSATPRAWIHGGGHAGGANNGLYRIDLLRMTWGIEEFPADPRQSDTLGMPLAYLNNGQAVVPCSFSPTGFGVMYPSYSTLFYWESTRLPTAAEKANPADPGGLKAVTPNYGKFPLIRLIPNTGTTGGDFAGLQNGRHQPTAAHIWDWWLYHKTTGQVFMGHWATNAVWTVKVNGKGPKDGWVVHERLNSNNTFISVSDVGGYVFEDEFDGKIWCKAEGLQPTSLTFHFDHKTMKLSGAAIDTSPYMTTNNYGQVNYVDNVCTINQYFRLWEWVQSKRKLVYMAPAPDWMGSLGVSGYQGCTYDMATGQKQWWIPNPATAPNFRNLNPDETNVMSWVPELNAMLAQDKFGNTYKIDPFNLIDPGVVLRPASNRPGVLGQSRAYHAPATPYAFANAFESRADLSEMWKKLFYWPQRKSMVHLKNDTDRVRVCRMG
jgi:hypothetical protein